MKKKISNLFSCRHFCARARYSLFLIDIFLIVVFCVFALNSQNVRITFFSFQLFMLQFFFFCAAFEKRKKILSLSLNETSFKLKLEQRERKRIRLTTQIITIMETKITMCLYAYEIRRLFLL